MQNTVSLKSFLLLAIFILFFSLHSFSQSKTHTVKSGETLFSIAQQYDVSLQQLKQWNNMKANELKVGQQLTIRQPEKKEDNAQTHTVEAQETLFSISKTYNVSITEIKTWNDLSSNNLSVGQKLTIYPSEKKSSEQQSIVIDEEIQKNTYYTVKSGDSLYRIAQAHDMTVSALKRLNDLSSNTIRVGQKLTVKSMGGDTPPSVATKANSSPQGKFITHKVSGSANSLEQILDKYRMNKAEFRALNPGVNGETFRPGKKLTVLAPPTKNYKNPYLNNTNMQSLGSTAVSRYSENEKTNPTTNGELYNASALTAAHSNIALGSVIFIENPENNKGVYLRVNDRNSTSTLKLSDKAWQMLDFESDTPTVMIYQN